MQTSETELNADEIKPSHMDEQVDTSTVQTTPATHTQSKITKYTVMGISPTQTTQNKKRRKTKSGEEEIPIVLNNIDQLVEDLVKQQIGYELIHDIDNRVTELTVKVNTNEGKLRKEINDLQKSIEFKDNEIELLKKENQALKNKTQALEGRLIRNEKMITDNKEMIVDNKVRNMINNIVFHNIPEEGHQEDTMRVIHKFCETSLKIRTEDLLNRVQFDRVHRMGNKIDGKHRPIVAKCVTTLGKNFLMMHGKNLKGTNFRITDQIPQETAERRSLLYHKFNESKASGGKPKWIGENLLINGKLHKPIIDKQDFNTLAIEEEEIPHIHHTDLYSENNSTFQAHSAKVNNKDLVLPVINKLYSDHNIANATHNIYAYRIKNGNGIIENTCDDGEHGAGRKMLQLLRNHNVENVILIVSRWYGGSHLGPRRFDIIQNQGIQALTLLHPEKNFTRPENILSQREHFQRPQNPNPRMQTPRMQNPRMQIPTQLNTNRMPNNPPRQQWNLQPTHQHY
jgi:predicted Fe-Mo cluster-binding NifX family protein